LSVEAAETCEQHSPELTLVFESTTNGTDDGSTDIGRFVNELEVLSTSFTNETRVREVVVHLSGNLLPEVLEDVSRTSEVKSGEHAVRNDLVDERDGGVSVGAGKELDDVLGKTSFEEDLEDYPRGVGGHGRRLPDENVSGERGSSDEVTSDSGEATGCHKVSVADVNRLSIVERGSLEGSDGENETFEGTVLDLVPDTGRVLGRLLTVEVFDLRSTETEEIGEL
jgi:hypothetical protein